MSKQGPDFNCILLFVYFAQTVYITTEYFPISFWDSRQYVRYLFDNLYNYLLLILVDRCYIWVIWWVFISQSTFVSYLMLHPYQYFYLDLFHLCWFSSYLYFSYLVRGIQRKDLCCSYILFIHFQRKTRDMAWCMESSSVNLCSTLLHMYSSFTLSCTAKK